MKLSEKISAMDPREVREKLMSLAETEKESGRYFDLCLYLRRAYREELWRDWGFRSWEVWVGKEFPSWRDRWVRGMVAVGDAIVRCDLEPEQLEGITVSAAVIVSGRLRSPVDVPKVLKEARGMSQRRLVTTRVTRTKERPSQFRVWLYREQRATVLEAVLVAKKVAGTSHDGEALTCMAQEFLEAYPKHREAKG